MSDTLEFVKLAGAAAAFSAGLYQYRQAQRWKRMEFVAQQIEKFRADPRIQRVLTMLDWNERPIDFGSGPVPVNHAIMAQALTPHHLRTTPYFTPVEAQIRDHFDTFLDALSHFQNFIAAGLIAPRELQPYLDYWARSLAGEDKVDPALLRQLWLFVDTYGFHGARTLVTSYYPELARRYPLP